MVSISTVSPWRANVAAAGPVEMIERLLKAGADANTATPGGETALMTAARTGSAAALKALLAAGASIDTREPRRGQTALMWASAAGNVDGMKVLIESGADIKARSNEVDFKRVAGRGESGARVAANQPPAIQFSPLAFAVRGGPVRPSITLAASRSGSPDSPATALLRSTPHDRAYGGRIERYLR